MHCVSLFKIVTQKCVENKGGVAINKSMSRPHTQDMMERKPFTGEIN